MPANNAPIPAQWRPAGFTIGTRSFTGSSARITKCNGMHIVVGETITYKVGESVNPVRPCTLLAATRIAGTRFHITTT